MQECFNNNREWRVAKVIARKRAFSRLTLAWNLHVL